MTKSWFTLWFWDMAFLRIIGKWCQNVKCLLQIYWLGMYMVLPHSQSLWNQGYVNPLKLYCNLTWIFTFSGERAPGFHQIFIEIDDSRKFKDSWLILRPSVCLLRRKWGSKKNVFREQRHMRNWLFQIHLNTKEW